jgi:tripartite-type tricarboxylate transporter receptor subunit TctC
MKTNRRKVIQGISALGLLGFAQVSRAAGDAYPNRPIHIVVPYGPGSGTDMVPRAFGELMSQDLKQTIIVDNRPGADGAIGTGFVGQAAPDGYTLLAGAAGPLVTGPYIQNLSFDPAKTLVPVAMLAYSPFVLIVPKDSPYKSVTELVAAAKANPGKLTFASSGIGSSGHLAGALLEKDAGVQMLHVPYASASSAVVDVIAGRIDCFFAAFPSASAAIKGKQVRAIAMATVKRSPLMPELPTVAEAGYPDFDTGTWIAILAPAGTPASTVDTLYKSIAKTIEMPKIKTFLAQIGCQPDLMNPKQLGDYLASERARWRELIEEFGLAKK